MGLSTEGGKWQNASNDTRADQTLRRIDSSAPCPISEVELSRSCLTNEVITETEIPPQLDCDARVIAWKEVLIKLFTRENGTRERIAYDIELNELEQRLKIPCGSLLSQALSELEDYAPLVCFDEIGGILNSDHVGEAFHELYQLAVDRVQVSIASDYAALLSDQFPLSNEMAAELSPIIEDQKAVAVIIAKEPPRRAAEELRKLAEEKLGGVISLLQQRELWKQIGASSALIDYLDHATVRLLTTSENKEHNQLASRLNNQLEQRGGFEDQHWTTLVKGVTQSDRHHALKEALVVCFPVVICIKALESFAPGLVHSVGGMLDDLFGAIIPDVSQSMGRPGVPFSGRFKQAWPVLREGLISLPIAAGLGWAASALYASSVSQLAHGVAGALFALACSAGTVGTSIGAFRKSLRTVDELRKDPLIAPYLEQIGFKGRALLAFQDSILDVPFRVGHTVIGVPLQLALGVAAGVGGFFHNGLFVMAEGMLETLLGAATAFGYPSIKAFSNSKKLKQLLPNFEDREANLQ